MFFKKKILSLTLLVIIISNISSCTAQRKNNLSVKNNDEISFLTSIKDIKADYEQTHYNNKETSINTGKIVIKKPDNILLTHKDRQMKLKIISVNGNVKIFDETTKQITHVDNNYGELMQFFTKNLKPEKLIKNKYGDLCVKSNRLYAFFHICLKIDLEQKTLLNITVFNRKYTPISIIKFKNVQINSGVDDNIFFIKDKNINFDK